MLELRQVSAGYRGVPVMEDVTLSFRPGEVLVLAGPNGCGKSTLLRTALGLQPRLAGEILLDGQPLESFTPREIARRAAFLTQSRAVPDLTAERLVLHGRFPHLTYPRRYGQRDRDIARRALERTGASELAPRPLAELSGGQRQKVYLALALAQEAQTLLLDEPTSFLDIRHQLELMTLARTLASEGRAVVMVLHDLCLALRCADRLALLDKGRLRACGSPEAVRTGGVLEEVFGVTVGRVPTESGPEYYYRPLPGAGKENAP